MSLCIDELDCSGKYSSFNIYSSQAEKCISACDVSHHVISTPNTVNGQTLPPPDECAETLPLIDDVQSAGTCRRDQEQKTSKAPRSSSDSGLRSQPLVDPQDNGRDGHAEALRLEGQSAPATLPLRGDIHVRHILAGQGQTQQPKHSMPTILAVLAEGMRSSRSTPPQQNLH